MKKRTINTHRACKILKQIFPHEMTDLEPIAATQIRIKSGIFFRIAAYSTRTVMRTWILLCLIKESQNNILRSNLTHLHTG